MLIGREKEHEIRERAYTIWEHQGRPNGTALANWLQAEAEVGTELDAVTEAAAAVRKATNTAVDLGTTTPASPQAASTSARPARARKATSSTARTTKSATKSTRKTSAKAASTSTEAPSSPAGNGGATTPRKARSASPKRPSKK